jgi:hydroxymethylbilane synthase
MQNVIKIATRESQLALWQAKWVQHALQLQHPSYQFELLPMTTQGDQMLSAPLAKVGGKGLFLKELEVALLDGRADIAVHSLKDVPAELPGGLVLHTYCPRAACQDAFVSNHFASLQSLPKGAVVGTSSLRRTCLLKTARPDLVINNLRGSVQTRLAKLDSGQYDAILLAAAGLERLGLEARIAQYLPVKEFIPAVGQGVMAIECRDEDSAVKALLTPLDCPLTRLCAVAEREVNRLLEGGCQVPMGVYASLNETFELSAMVGMPDGAQVVRASGQLQPADINESAALQLAERVAKTLIDQGGKEILRKVYANA